MYPHRFSTYHSGSIGPDAGPPKSSPNPGPAGGVFAPDAAGSVPAADALEACTVNVYAVPFASPATGICTYVLPLLPVTVPADPAAVVVAACAAPAMYGVAV